jgi:hypothetical protein
VFGKISTLTLLSRRQRAMVALKFIIVGGGIAGMFNHPTNYTWYSLRQYRHSGCIYLQKAGHHGDMVTHFLKGICGRYAYIAMSLSELRAVTDVQEKNSGSRDSKFTMFVCPQLYRQESQRVREIHIFDTHLMT